MTPPTLDGGEPDSTDLEDPTGADMKVDLQATYASHDDEIVIAAGLAEDDSKELDPSVGSLRSHCVTARGSVFKDPV
jgi:hypothetical protein